MFAPSAGNEQPWQFVVLDDRKVLDDVPKVLLDCCHVQTVASCSSGLRRCDTRKSILDFGCRIARQRWRISCSPPMPWVWVRSGSASIL